MVISAVSPAPPKPPAMFNAFDPRPDAVVLLRDDDRQTERRSGLQQAREYMAPRLKIPIVIGLAHVMRECWVLAGFIPRDKSELAKIEQLRHGDELGFDPSVHADRLIAKNEMAKRSAKRVLAHLTNRDHEREAACWREIPLREVSRPRQNSRLDRVPSGSLRTACSCLYR